jgi:hypothetical protein
MLCTAVACYVLHFRLDPGDLKGGLQTLYENQASSQQVQQFLQDAKDYEVSTCTYSYHSYFSINNLSCTDSILAVKLHWMEKLLLYTVTDQDIDFLVPDHVERR